MHKELQTIYWKWNIYLHNIITGIVYCMKQTKIIATIGGVSSSPQMIEQMILNGVNVFRLNFSHGTHQDHADNIAKIRAVSKKLQDSHHIHAYVAIMADLQGPKIRVGKFANGYIDLQPQQKLVLDTQITNGEGNLVPLDFKPLVTMVKAEDVLLLDDGKVELRVDEVKQHQVLCTVIHGTKLSNNKGINKLGGGLNSPSLTEKDLADLEFALQRGVDFVAVSFVYSNEDIIIAKQHIDRMLSSSTKDIVKPKIIAKLERYEAVYHNLDAIIQASDGVMVARGDLAIEVGLDKVPALQKLILKKCKQFDCMSIVATQMLESMITASVATRAEVSDIANAVLDGADAVMLSAETAAGSYPLEAVQTMYKTCLATEEDSQLNLDMSFVNKKFTSIEHTIAMSALFSAYHLNADAIITITASGNTAYQLSRLMSGIPIFAVSDNETVCQQMSILRSVYSVHLTHDNLTNDVSYYQRAIDVLVESGALLSGQKIVIIFGDSLAKIGSTNTMKITII